MSIVAWRKLSYTSLVRDGQAGGKDEKVMAFGSLNPPAAYLGSLNVETLRLHIVVQLYRTPYLLSEQSVDPI